jgi:hypothetical protein
MDIFLGSKGFAAASKPKPFSLFFKDPLDASAI